MGSTSFDVVCFARARPSCGAQGKGGGPLKPLASFGHKDPTATYRQRPGAYAVVADGTGKIALVRTPVGYFLPGGGIEAGESHQACLEREALEELGCRITVGPYIGTAERYFWWEPTKQHIHSIAHFYAAHLEPRSQEPTEKDHELVWESAAFTCEHLVHEHQVWAVRQAQTYWRRDAGARTSNPDE